MARARKTVAQSRVGEGEGCPEPFRGASRSTPKKDGSIQEVIDDQAPFVEDVRT